MTITHLELRQLFINFFVDLGYKFVPSASIIPQNDPSILFINSGMAPLKHYFLSPSISQKIVSIQKCIRAGGKHNDLDNVGYTKRHHTFFEMCGNFSFGDCTREDAICSAWNFLTKILKLDPIRLSVTVHPEDHETLRIWQKYIAHSHIGFDNTNEWSAGDVGPQGLCTEIYYDHKTNNKDDVVEIWNIVFISHNKLPDGSIKLLERMCVDTGMGIERVLAILSDSSDNYASPIFKQIIQNIEQKSFVTANPSHKIIADHARSCSFMIAEGIIPGNTSREYILRRILRRAMLHEQKLNCHNILNDTVDLVIQNMSSVYPELNQNSQIIHNIINQEREQYMRICQHGIKKLNSALSVSGSISPQEAFKLYDTYGLHIDIIQDILKEKGLSIDTEEFTKLIEQNRRSTTKTYDNSINFSSDIKSDFIGYDQTSCSSQIIAVVDNPNNEGIVLNQTVFYPEGGGQQSDQGTISNSNWAFNVNKVEKHQGAIIHFGEYTDKNRPNIGESCISHIDILRRRKLTQHHSATHLLLNALQQHVGKHIVQKGSLVEPHGLRFDFLYNRDRDNINYDVIERQINEWVELSQTTETQWCDINSAKQQGAIATFGDKYDDTVRVVTIGSSKELCTGTHVNSTADIGQFHIVRAYTVASGIKRIEAICGMSAYDYAKTNISILKRMADKYRTNPSNLENVIETRLSHKKSLSSQVQQNIINTHDVSICCLVLENSSKNEIYKHLSKNILQYDAVLTINTTCKSHEIILKATGRFINNLREANVLMKQLADYYHCKAGGKTDVASCSIGLEHNVNHIEQSIKKIFHRK